ncbi:MAG TPA: crotonyl-CoA carboxylase/reductase [Actinomycetota bacterium]|nr:crotonyl-CoA carboxylase/reductase [Actinomycetota bacterium]
MFKDLYEIGEIPPIGEVPARMFAQVIRPERFGEPERAFQVEEIDIPGIGPDDALVLVMAAGINYNNVWAARGVPVDVCEIHGRFGEPTGFHIGGSDASGVVYAVGDRVENVRVGDHVVIHCGQWDADDPTLAGGEDPAFAPSFRIWGYESNWGSFAQFTKVQAHQCLPKAPQLTWEEAAAPTLVGATAYRMLLGWAPHTVRADDVVLIWGGAGGLGSMAIQLVRELGGKAVAVVSSEEKADFCKRLGAVGTIDRKQFSHWGMPPHWTDADAYGQWFEGAKAFGKALWEAVGEKRAPRIVFEHPGEETIPTSIFVCDTGGMVVICAGTTGYNAVADLRYLWMRQKRFQGSHFANDEQSAAFNELVIGGRIDPCLSRTFWFQDIGQAHQLMGENAHPEGNMAALVSAPGEGLTDFPT